ncbi:hypothetical protein OS493_035722 [Desmophyllum pertusum]|uniref:Uncharacterized protein n=1 Tax=Desmophyllum pertusum TaxID=174260 RepID=A0A9W9Y7I3_9CNID|nr:hypothetical protein OS493_035722 [Desmophyllum pertusum]
MEEFSFDEWITNNKLKKETVDELKKHDLDGDETLRLLDANDLAELKLSTAKDSGLNAILQQLENDGGLDAIINGSIEQPAGQQQKPQEAGASARLDTDPQVFLGPSKPKGMTEQPLLIPDFVQSFGYGQDEFEEHELTHSPQQRVVVRTARGKA